ncbi:methyl-accepting chemotaxis protein [Spirochaeta thermophila]|uniref:Methyl-accepting chemotaxis sensory transducer n=1 Tax=Winmispira thermophila (strain ATCC 49972 / DSM 6192 / RI 19.B1) TaxID=665571 RepID=E0RQV6_WINT6|nr:methyl-accepting chemotaxis protein [Spirochaeta thermophila]ADN03012.1 hypothetical protein STHERM_c20810 [Spirochaeta thermophila DSM 6192]
MKLRTTFGLLSWGLGGLSFLLCLSLALLDQRIWEAGAMETSAYRAFSRVVRLASLTEALLSPDLVSPQMTFRQWGKALTEATRDLEGVLPDLDTTLEQELVAQVSRSWETYRTSLLELERVFPLGGVEPAYVMTTRSTQAELLYRFDTLLHSLSWRVEGLLAAGTRVRLALFAVLVVFLALSILLSLSVGVRLARRITALEQVLRAVRGRDLTLRPADRSRDELGEISRHLAATLESLRELVYDAQVTTGKVVSLHHVLSEGEERTLSMLSQIEQELPTLRAMAAALESHFREVVKRVEEIEARTSGLSMNTSSQYEHIRRIEEVVRASHEILTRMEERAGVERRRVEEVRRLLQEGEETFLSSRSLAEETHRELSAVLEVVDVIDDIARQTDILSINAAIESAHAGAAGRGFAVVAGQIRALAEKVGEHSSQIKDTVSRLLGRMEETTSAARRGYDLFERIGDRVRGLLGALESFSEETQRVASEIGTIRAASARVEQDSLQVSEGAGIIAAQARRILEEVKDLEQASVDLSRISRETEQALRESLDSFSRTRDVVEETRSAVEDLSPLLMSFRVAVDMDEETIPVTALS